MADVMEVWKRALEARKRRDIDAVVAGYAEDAVLEGPGGREIKGREAIRSYWQAQFDAGVAEITPLNQAVSGQTVYYEFLFTGTHTGPLPMPDGTTVPGSGKRFTHKVVAVTEIEGDLIKSSRTYFDRMTVLSQLGLLPQPQA